MIRHTRKIALAFMALGLVAGSEATAQVRSITLGLRTHCPYGIRGCWPEIRDGLEMPPEITAIDGQPDIQTDTCDVQMKDGWCGDPNLFQRNFLDMRIGVDVRGVEAVVEGQLISTGTNLILRVGGDTKAVLQLAPLDKKVQWDKQTKQPAAATPAEQGAFDALNAGALKQSGRVRVTGPLRRGSDAAAKRDTLEVRIFEWLDRQS